MTLAEIQEEVSDHLDKIKSYFKPGARVLVMVGFANDQEGRKDFVMGDLDPQEAMDMAARAKSRAVSGDG